MTGDLVYTLFYFLLAACVIYPPVEFVSVGFTIEKIFSDFLGSKRQKFVLYHVKRSALTLFIHSMIPFLYFSFNVNYWSALQNDVFWRSCFFTTLVFPTVSCFLIFYWHQDNWSNHPICKNIKKFCNNNTTWETVATQIDLECSRIENLIVRSTSTTEVIVTENWVLKATHYFLYCAHQSDSALVALRTEEYALSADYGQAGTQIVNIEVTSTRPNVKPFIIRLNALDFKDVQDRLSRQIVILPSVKLHKSLIERFAESFKQQILENGSYEIAQGMVSECLGCLLAEANVKIHSKCGRSDCGRCFCRPSWCADCLGRWFATRLDEREIPPERWMASRCGCPMCRAKFCVLDVSFTRVV